MTARRPTLERLARFVAVSVVSVPLNLVVTVVVHELLGASEEVAFAVGLITVFSFSFISCRYIIYRASGGDPRRQLIKYVLSSAAFRSAEYAGFIVVHTLFDVQYLVAIVLVLGTSFFGKFFFYGNVVFTDNRQDIP